LNPRPVDRKSNALPVAPPRHIVVVGLLDLLTYVWLRLKYR